VLHKPQGQYVQHKTKLPVKTYRIVSYRIVYLYKKQ